MLGSRASPEQHMLGDPAAVRWQDIPAQLFFHTRTCLRAHAGMVKPSPPLQRPSNYFAAIGSSGGPSPFRDSAHACAKACRLEQPCRQTVQDVDTREGNLRLRLQDPVGDGRCGFRSLALQQGRSWRQVMQDLCKCMVAAPRTEFTSKEVLDMIVASDPCNPCPRSAWLCERRIRLLVSSAPAAYPSGILVKSLDSELHDWLWLRRDGCKTVRTEDVRFLLTAGPRPCMLGHTRYPRMHFMALQCVAFEENVPDCVDLGSSPRTVGEESGYTCRFREGADMAAEQAMASAVQKLAKLPETSWLLILQYAVSVQATYTLCRLSRQMRGALCNLPFGVDATCRFPTNALAIILASLGVFELCGLPSPCSN